MEPFLLTGVVSSVLTAIVVICLIHNGEEEEEPTISKEELLKFRDSYPGRLPKTCFLCYYCGADYCDKHDITVYKYGKCKDYKDDLGKMEDEVHDDIIKQHVGYN